jgi:hypothetical protein
MPAHTHTHTHSLAINRARLTRLTSQPYSLAARSYAGGAGGRGATPGVAAGALEAEVMADAPGYEAAFASSKGPELWVMLLEKAYAKFIGARGVGYQVWRGGTRSAGFVLVFVSAFRIAPGCCG